MAFFSFSFFTYFFLWFFKQLLGSPDDSDLGFLRSDNARKYVKQLPHFPKQPFAMKFPHVSPVAIDLAEKMLVFDPCKRITGILPNFTWLNYHFIFNFSDSFFWRESFLLLLTDTPKVEEALNHPYLSGLHEINEEPTCPSPFVFDFEHASLNEEDIKELIWRESLNFNPL